MLIAFILLIIGLVLRVRKKAVSGVFFVMAGCFAISVVFGWLYLMYYYGFIGKDPLPEGYQAEFHTTVQIEDEAKRLWDENAIIQSDGRVTKDGKVKVWDATIMGIDCHVASWRTLEEKRGYSVECYRPAMDYDYYLLKELLDGEYSDIAHLSEKEDGETGGLDGGNAYEVTLHTEGMTKPEELSALLDRLESLVEEYEDRRLNDSWITLYLPRAQGIPTLPIYVAGLNDYVKTERPNINIYFFSDIPRTPNDGGITGHYENVMQELFPALPEISEAMYERDFLPEVYARATEPVVAGEYYLRGLMLFDGEITGEWLDTYRMEEAKPDVTFERITPKDSLESRGYRNVTWYYSREFENEFKPERYKGHFYISEAGILFDLTTR